MRWIEDFGFITKKQFNSGKNLSIVEKNKQKIKKVLKNKKFRNYININKIFDNPIDNNLDLGENK